MILKTKNIYLTTVIILFITVLSFFVYYEINKSKSDLFSILHQQSLTLVRTLSQSIETSLETNIEIEDMLLQRLYLVSSMASHLDNDLINKRITSNNISKSYGIDYLWIFDNNSKCLFANSSKQFIPDKELYEEIFQDSDDVELGFRTLDNGEEAFLTARKRIGGNGIIISGFSIDNIMQFRMKIGIGKKIKDIAKDSGVVYCVLQDKEGIIAASERVSELNSILNDTFLLKSINHNLKRTRVIEFHSNPVFEAVAPVSTDNNQMLIRIGLSMSKIESIRQESMIRTIILGSVIAFVGFLGFVLAFFRQKAKRQLKEIEELNLYSDYILNSINDPVLVFDRNMLLIMFNYPAVELFSNISNLLIGTDYNKIFFNDELNLREFLQTGFSRTFRENSALKSNGEKIYYNNSISIIESVNRENDKIVCVIKDLTDIKKSQDLSYRNEKLEATGKLAAAVAHEIRNPLNAINMIAQRFEYEFEPKSDAENYNKLVRTIRNESQRLNKIISDFLEYSKPDVYDYQKVKLCDLMEDVSSILVHNIKKSNIDFQYYCDDNIVLDLDKDKFKQAIINLGINAIEAMPDGGSLIVKSFKDKEDYLISIQDSGSGISPDIENKVFDLYFTTKSKGNGLGLAIVQKIINAHNAELTFVSNLGFKGTRFEIRFKV